MENTIRDVIDRLKRSENLRHDDEVATLLKISKQSLGGFKKRGKIPYEALGEFCIEKGISMDEILFGIDAGEKLNIELKMENERLKAKLEYATSLIQKDYAEK